MVPELVIRKTSMLVAPGKSMRSNVPSGIRRNPCSVPSSNNTLPQMTPVLAMQERAILSTIGVAQRTLSGEGFRGTVGSARTPPAPRSNRKGDVLVVWKLDRLSRSLGDVPTIMERLAEAEAGFRSLTEAIQNDSGGKDDDASLAELRAA